MRFFHSTLAGRPAYLPAYSLACLLAGASFLACGRAAPVTPSTPATIAKEGPAAVAKPIDLSCDDPVLWLAQHSMETVEDRYCSACDCGVDQNGERSMGWSFLSRDRNPLTFGCRDLEYVELAIKAFHGMPVDDSRYAKLIEGKSWYRPSEEFSVSKMPTAARENARWFEVTAQVCERQTWFRYAAPYEKRVTEWFQKKKKGVIELPKHVFVDQAPASQKQFLDFIAHGGQSVFELSPRTPIAWSEHTALFESLLPGIPLAVIGVSTSAPTLSCLGECEGYEFIQFIFDRDYDELIAIHVSAAG